MDFRLSEEQRLWRKAVHDFVSKEIKCDSKNGSHGFIGDERAGNLRRF